MFPKQNLCTQWIYDKHRENKMDFLSVTMKQASFDMMRDVQDFMKNEITVIPMTDDDKSKKTST